MGAEQGRSRKRAVGTRDRIMAYLARAGEVSDHNGKASTVLAAAVGYPGSSVAFAQLLTGMDRAGLIQREIRGKRTYRIIRGPAAPAAAPGADAGAPAPRPAGPEAAASEPLAAPSQGSRSRSAGIPALAEAVRPDLAGYGTGPGRPAGAAAVDYDELARRLLVQVATRLAGPDRGPGPAGVDSVLTETVAGLERKLATAMARERRLAEENTRLREQLRAAEQGLAEAQDWATAEALAGRFGRAEVLLLERLLSPLRGERRRDAEADAG
ncbi:MAG TPA: hypothetical protein VMH35_09465 [Streptosporangiaceae bacterium]|nr:hypothetical protein [Streptosporangiaceae bacterium]